ncbi:MerR family transcriptional regulator [Nocardia uniformis]|uniref:MerR family transcriptional regulator n=1 Tax=Nocardia uniformis TaxID=53432 RepID=UPI00082D3EC9|nr:MerR family transcriptional regulator [Nocardia uniformis]
MTGDTVRSELVSIGELSQLTGVAVRTVRFYCDSGVLASVRSSGGHRLFDRTTAVDRLLLIRRLRALGLGLVAIGAVLDGERAMADAIAAERAAVDIELGALAWRRASLRAIEDAAPSDRAARLELLAAVRDGGSAYDLVVTFWRRILAPTSPDIFEGFVAMNVPEPLRAPTPDQVVGYAELVTLVGEQRFATAVSQQLWCSDSAGIRDRAGLLAGVADACGMAGAEIDAGLEPSPGQALDRFVDAHATARDTRDTPDFRRRLRAAARGNDPRTQRYWLRTGEILGATTAGAAQRWLFDALDRTTRT